MQESDASTEMAKRRSRDAAERTLLAWVRTSLALIGFGFGIAQLIETLSTTAAVARSPYLVTNVRIFGMSFIVLGVVSVIIALIQHRYEIKYIDRPTYQYKAPFPLAFSVAAIITVIGIFTFLVLLVGMFVGT